MPRRPMRLRLVPALLLAWPLLQCAGWDWDWREDEETNNAVQPPEEVMDMIGVSEGMVIGEFGAHFGRFTIPLATRVGETGIIYANDIDESALSFVRRRCEEAGLRNVRTILGRVDDPLFPARSLDMAFSSLVYHELGEPVTFLKNVLPALKPDAKIAIVDYHPSVNKEQSNLGRDWRQEFSDAGLDVVSEHRLHERDVLFLLKLKPPRPPASGQQ